MMLDDLSVHGSFPALVEALGNVGPRGKCVLQSESDVGLPVTLLVRKPAFDLAPLVGQSSRIDQKDTISTDAEVFQVSIHREQSVAPAGLPKFQKPIEPQLYFRVSSLLGECCKQRVQGR